MKVVIADTPNLPDLQADLSTLQVTYESLGVEVILYRMEEAAPDSVFLRDVFAWTPFKLIRPQMMGKESRRHEPKAFFDKFYPEDEPIARASYYWLKEGSFEGADLIWPTHRHFILGIGERTNDAAAADLTTWLESKDEYCTNTTLYLPSWHPQHLLGLLNVVRGDHFVIDQRVYEECEGNPPSFLEGAVILPHEEYAAKHTNFVQYNEHIVINAGAVRTREILVSRGLTVHPVEIPALIANGGGVACTTGVLAP